MTNANLETSSFTIADVLENRTERLFQSYLAVDRHEIRHRRFDGSESALLTREVLERGHVSAVLLVDPGRREIVLIEQIRPGALAAGWEPWLLECVAGIIEPGETAEAVARRESLEEAGCAVSTLIPIARFLTSPGACSETVALYCGITQTTDVGGIHGLDEEGEDILVRAVPFAQAFDLMDAGRIVNAKTLIALQWLRLNEGQIDVLAAEHSAEAR